MNRVGCRSGCPQRTLDQGSAIADFVMVTGLLLVVVLGVIQLATTLHVRNTLIDCAGEGARYGALAGNNIDDAKDRAARLADASLSESFATQVEASEVFRQGVALIEVRIESPLPFLGFLGPANQLVVTGHATKEGL